MTVSLSVKGSHDLGLIGRQPCPYGFFLGGLFLVFLPMCLVRPFSDHRLWIRSSYDITTFFFDIGEAAKASFLCFSVNGSSPFMSTYE